MIPFSFARTDSGSLACCSCHHYLQFHLYRYRRSRIRRGVFCTVTCRYGRRRRRWQSGSSIPTGGCCCCSGWLLHHPPARAPTPTISAVLPTFSYLQLRTAYHTVITGTPRSVLYRGGRLGFPHPLLPDSGSTGSGSPFPGYLHHRSAAACCRVLLPSATACYHLFCWRSPATTGLARLKKAI